MQQIHFFTKLRWYFGKMDIYICPFLKYSMTLFFFYLA